MKKQPLGILLVLAIGLAVSQAGMVTQTPEDILKRLADLEDQVSAQSRSKEELQNSLNREIDRRLVLETLLMRTIEEQTLRIDQLEASLKVDQDHYLALQSTLQDEISLREEAEITSHRKLEELKTQVFLVEGNLNTITFMDSRVRDLEELLKVQGQVVTALENDVPQMRKAMDQLRRELRKQKNNVGEVAATGRTAIDEISKIEERVYQLDNWVITHNVSSQVDHHLLQEVENTTTKLSTFLGEVQDSLDNLTLAVNSLRNHTTTTPLKLCPADYRKVGEDCLFLLQEKHTWDEARLECEALAASVGGAGDLAEPSYIPEFRNYVGKLEIASQYLWVGGIRESSVWRWASGLDIDHQDLPWDLGEPDDAVDQYHLCVRSSANIKFHDCKDTARLKSVCQIR